eukprot:Em0005g1440a
MQMVRGGYLALTGVHKILEFDFQTLSRCSDILLDVRLVGVSSNTKATPPPFSFLIPTSGCFTSHGIRLQVRLYAGRPPPTPPTTTPLVSYIERHEVCRLNDVLYMECYLCSLREAILTARKEALSGSESEEDEMVSGSDGGVADCLVLDLTHGPSLFGIVAAKEGADFVQVGRSQPMYQSFQTCVAEANGVLEHIAISRLELSSLTPSHPVWDVVVSDVDVDCDGPFTTERAAYDVCKEVPSKRRKKKEDCVSPHSLTNDESFDLIGENITGVVTEGTYRKLEATRSPDVNPPQSHRPYRQEEISKIKMDIGRFGADNGGTANLPNASSRWSKYLCEQGDTENTSH